MSLTRKALAAAVAGTLSLSPLASAQAQVPSDLRDLVGAKAGQAEGELRSRGYHDVRSQQGNGSSQTYWRRGDTCVQITTRDGRYLTIVNAPGFCGADKSSSSSSAATAVIAGVAVVGLAAAIAAHNSKHKDADRDHDAEYERGYQAALYGSDYDDRHETEGYHEGYLAGQAERDNRRYSNTRWVRQASPAARDACSRRADEFQGRPHGSSVPISVREIGRGDFEMTMATGSYRSVCVVSGSGSVRSIEPY